MSLVGSYLEGPELPFCLMQHSFLQPDLEEIDQDSLIDSYTSLPSNNKCSLVDVEKCYIDRLSKPQQGTPSTKSATRVDGNGAEMETPEDKPLAVLDPRDRYNRLALFDDDPEDNSEPGLMMFTNYPMEGVLQPSPLHATASSMKRHWEHLDMLNFSPTEKKPRVNISPASNFQPIGSLLSSPRNNADSNHSSHTLHTNPPSQTVLSRFPLTTTAPTTVSNSSITPASQTTTTPTVTSTSAVPTSPKLSPNGSPPQKLQLDLQNIRRLNEQLRYDHSNPAPTGQPPPIPSPVLSVQQRRPSFSDEAMRTPSPYHMDGRTTPITPGTTGGCADELDRLPPLPAENAYSRANWQEVFDRVRAVLKRDSIRQKIMAAEIGFSGSTLSPMLSNKYRHTKEIHVNRLRHWSYRRDVLFMEAIHQQAAGCNSSIEQLNLDVHPDVLRVWLDFSMDVSQRELIDDILLKWLKSFNVSQWATLGERKWRATSEPEADPRVFPASSFPNTLSCSASGPTSKTEVFSTQIAVQSPHQNQPQNRQQVLQVQSQVPHAQNQAKQVHSSQQSNQDNQNFQSAISQMFNPPSLAQLVSNQPNGSTNHTTSNILNLQNLTQNLPVNTNFLEMMQNQQNQPQNQQNLLRPPVAPFLFRGGSQNGAQKGGQFPQNLCPKQPNQQFAPSPIHQQQRSAQQQVQQQVQQQLPLQQNFSNSNFTLISKPNGVQPIGVCKTDADFTRPETLWSPPRAHAPLPQPDNSPLLFNHPKMYTPVRPNPQVPHNANKQNSPVSTNNTLQPFTQQQFAQQQQLAQQHAQQRQQQEQQQEQQQFHHFHLLQLHLLQQQHLEQENGAFDNYH